MFLLYSLLAGVTAFIPLAYYCANVGIRTQSGSFTKKAFALKGETQKFRILESAKKPSKYQPLTGDDLLMLSNEFADKYIHSARCSLFSPDVKTKLEAIIQISQELGGYYGSRKFPTETGVLFHNVLTDYAPTPLNIYCKLPQRSRIQNDTMDVLLAEQMGKLVKAVQDASEAIFDESTQAMKEHAMFLDTKFVESEQNLLTIKKQKKELKN